MSLAATPLPSIVFRSIQTPKIFSPLSLPTSHNFRFPPLTQTNLIIKSSSKPLYDTVSEEEEEVIGDCLVFEEGIFDDPFLQNNLKSTQIKNNSRSVKSTLVSPSPENLIPEKWLEIQEELNITKKERRKLSQQMEFGRKVEGRRKALMPIVNKSEVFEKFKNEKLKELKPLKLDNPEFKRLQENDKKEDDKKCEEIVIGGGRVAARNPKLAVYGGGLEDISEFFSSETYQPGVSNDFKGKHKMFSKEEKLLLNKRIPDLTVAGSGKWHPLHTLAASGEFYLMNSLLKHNLEINAPDKDGLTAIHKAILGNKQAVFNFLLRESANPFVRDEEGATLMHYAVFAASCQMIKILLLYNVNINLQDNDGWTPLHLAMQSRRTDVVKLLLIKGADKTIKNRDGLTPLDICLYSGRDMRTYELIKLLKRLP